jgi:hypothetical protein
MRNMSNFRKCFLLLAGTFILSCRIYSQDCEFFKEYPNEVKTTCAKFIDSLRKSSVDTILFYGVGVGESGALAYGGIIWSTNVGIHSAEIIQGEYNRINRQFSLNSIVYDSLDDRLPIQFYLDNRLDTVNSNPRELHWMSHDFLHYVYASIAGTSTCFVAENYLLRDSEHLRSQWVILLNSSLHNSRKPYKLYYRVAPNN